MPKNGPSRPRLVDVAGKAGVSAAVVSAVLNPRRRGGGTVRVAAATAKRVRELAARMGYRPNAAAQQLKGKRSDVIGVLIGAQSAPVNFERLAALERAAEQRDYRLMIGEFRADDAGRITEYANDFDARGIEALVCFHNPLPKLDAAALRALSSLRAVVFQTTSPLASGCCVDVDRAAGVAVAVRHLYHRGRQRVALVLNENPRNDRLMADRRAGYLQSLRQAASGAAGKPLMWHGTGVFPPPRALVDEAVRAVVIEGGADAIVASNDVWAIELIKALRRAGRCVPGDVAVVGFDNLQAAELFDPALTSIDQDNEAFAAAVVELLLKSLHGDVPPAERLVIIQPRLVVREST